MVRFDLRQIEQQAGSGMISRSRGYERMTQIVGKEPGKITAKIRGTHLYETSIRQAINGHFVQECSCPYGAPCKHTMALARVINADINLKSYIEMKITGNKSEEFINISSDITSPWEEKEWDDPYVEEVEEKSESRETGGDLIALFTKKLQDQKKKEGEKPKGTRDRRLAYILSPYVYGGWGKPSRTLLSCGMRRADRGKNSPTWKYSDELYSDYYANREVAYMSDLDRRITAILSIPNGERITDYRHYSRTVLDKIVLEDMLKYLKEVPDLCWQTKNEKPRPLIIEREQELRLQIVRNKDKYVITPNIQIKLLFDYPRPVVLTSDLKLVVATNKVDTNLLRQVLNNPELPTGVENDPRAIITIMKVGKLLQSSPVNNDTVRIFVLTE